MQLKLNTQQGTTLIEVLVALAILTVGIFGMVSIQMYINTQVADQNQRNIAIWKADELVSRISINADPNAIAQYNISLNDPNLCTNVPPICEDTFTAGNFVPAQNCTSVQLAQFDSWQAMCFNNTASPITSTFTCLPNCDGVSPVEIILQWRSMSTIADARLITEDDGTEYTREVDGARVAISPAFDYYRTTIQP